MPCFDLAHRPAHAGKGIGHTDPHNPPAPNRALFIMVNISVDPPCGAHELRWRRRIHH
jgi:hypothetical protein